MYTRSSSGSGLRVGVSTLTNTNPYLTYNDDTDSEVRLVHINFKGVQLSGAKDLFAGDRYLMRPVMYMHSK